MDESRTRTIDAFCKIATALAVVVGVAFTAYSYVSNRTAQTKSMQIEAEKPYLEKRLEFYLDATSTVASIATSKNPDQVSKSKEHFSQLIYGPLRVVSTPEVINQMSAINECFGTEAGCTPTKLQGMAWELARLCGASMKAEWGDSPPGTPTNLTLTIN